MDSMRTVVVTGGTSGLGRATAHVLARQSGWRLVLAVRDVQRGAELARQLGPDTGVVELDLASLESVRTAAKRLTDEHAPIAALVLNAGLQVPRADRVSADGYELTFAVNHLGHFLLSELVRPALTPDARIAVVASGTHWGTLRKSGPFPAPRWADPHELARPGPGSGRVAYSTSKLANVYFGYEAARRYPGTPTNVYDPGLMPSTGLAGAYPAPARRVYSALAPLLTRLPGAATPEQSGAQLAQLVVGPQGARTGRYIALGKDAPSSPASYDADRARELWEASEQLVAR